LTNDYISPSLKPEQIKQLHSGWKKAVKRTLMK